MSLAYEKKGLKLTITPCELDGEGLTKKLGVKLGSRLLFSHWLLGTISIPMNGGHHVKESGVSWLGRGVSKSLSIC